MKLPFARSYWAEPHRLLAGFYPGDADPHVADRKLESLPRRRLRSIFNLMEPDERDHHGKRFIPYAERFEQLARERGLTVRCQRFAIPDSRSHRLLDE